jgi:formate C-acetyltransferase
VGALPDGRDAITPLADGSVSPVQGTDTKGPTAVFNSAAKVDHLGCEATLLNQKFNPTSVRTRAGIQKWGHLVKTYFDKGGYHCQFNIVSKEVLLDARANPKKYRDLVIRVAGFSAYFVELSDAVQDEIIARTEQIP